MLAEIAPIQQAGTHKPTAVHDKLRAVVTKLEKVTGDLGRVDVPLVQPNASEYRNRLIVCREAIDALIARLPLEDGEPAAVEESVAS